MDSLRMAAMLHDVGKIAISDMILKKPSRFSDDEYEIMKSHANKGREMIDDLVKNYSLDGVSYIDMLRNIALYHHEAFDGSGYPEGLEGDRIPLPSRIILLVDAFDAMTTDRPYRRALTRKEAFEKIKRGREKQFDPRLVDLIFYLEKNGVIDDVCREVEESDG